MKNFEFEKPKWRHRFSHGGILRNKRAGRQARPLSKEPLHVVFKSNRSGLRQPTKFALIQSVIRQYGKQFYVKVEQVSIQGDHVHLVVRSRKRTLYQNFFKVVSGQIAQRSVTATPTKAKERFWRYRPFTRVLRGYRNYKTAMNYVRLNADFYPQVRRLMVAFLFNLWFLTRRRFKDGYSRQQLAIA